VHRTAPAYSPRPDAFGGGKDSETPPRPKSFCGIGQLGGFRFGFLQFGSHLAHNIGVWGCFDAPCPGGLLPTGAPAQALPELDSSIPVAFLPRNAHFCCGSTWLLYAAADDGRAGSEL